MAREQLSGGADDGRRCRAGRFGLSGVLILVAIHVFDDTLMCASKVSGEKAVTRKWSGILYLYDGVRTGRL
ncbi:hypothetical protein BN2476_330008 [Paraburkholderia piptadeniae]|uniref:Uncharacterized protein n=1 Tax=Paraburkholderia piptadeniae TaxID=1701573 RepID=A0A1N7S6B2_9BURK|nr:hypothetical protein BN2476_330008 [Paraburkholderia piptadeniae]